MSSLEHSLSNKCLAVEFSKRIVSIAIYSKKFAYLWVTPITTFSSRKWSDVGSKWASNGKILDCSNNLSLNSEHTSSNKMKFTWCLKRVLWLSESVFFLAFYRTISNSTCYKETLKYLWNFTRLFWYFCSMNFINCHINIVFRSKLSRLHNIFHQSVFKPIIHLLIQSTKQH